MTTLHSYVHSLIVDVECDANPYRSIKKPNQCLLAKANDVFLVSY